MIGELVDGPGLGGLAWRVPAALIALGVQPDFVFTRDRDQLEARLLARLSRPEDEGQIRPSQRGDRGDKFSIGGEVSLGGDLLERPQQGPQHGDIFEEVAIESGEQCVARGGGQCPFEANLAEGAGSEAAEPLGDSLPRRPLAKREDGEDALGEFGLERAEFREQQFRLRAPHEEEQAGTTAGQLAGSFKHGRLVPRDDDAVKFGGSQQATPRFVELQAGGECGEGGGQRCAEGGADQPGGGSAGECGGQREPGGIVAQPAPAGERIRGIGRGSHAGRGRRERLPSEARDTGPQQPPGSRRSNAARTS